METLSDNINYHKNMENPPLDSIAVIDVKEFIKQLREDFKGFIFPSNKLINKIIDIRIGDALVLEGEA